MLYSILTILFTFLGKRCTILKKLKKSLSSKRKSSDSSLFPNYSYVSVPLETGITVPGHKRNCTPAGKVNHSYFIL